LSLLKAFNPNKLVNPIGAASYEKHITSTRKARQSLFIANP
jgi:hypothetical protein